MVLTCVQDLLHFGLSNTYIHRGYVINLCQDWQVINLPFWLYYGIPVFYTWGFNEKNNLRFSCLNFHLIELADDNHSLIQNAAGPALEAGLVQSAANSWNYNNYLTKADPKVVGSFSSYDSTFKFTVINFEGWGRWFIHEDQAPTYATHFHFMTSTDKGMSYPIVIFWRWKPCQ